MGINAVDVASVSLDDDNTPDPDEASKTDLVVEASSDGDIMGELGSIGDILTRVELDLTCVSEKLVNLSVLMMHVATKWNDFEAFNSEEGDLLAASEDKGLEIDLLSEVLDSEVNELDKCLTTIRSDILKSGKVISSNQHLGETFVTMEEKLHDSELSLKQSQDQVSEIRAQSAKFRRILPFFDGREHWNGNEESNVLEDDQCLNINAKINMQTVEQRRHILRLLEKSLAKELELDNKLSQSRQIEEELKYRLHSMEQELYFTEEETMDTYEKCFRAENTAEVLMGISKDLLSSLQIFQFNLNASTQRETELKSELAKSKVALESKEHALQKFDSSSAKLNDFLIAQTENLKASLTVAEDKLILANSEAFTLTEKVSSLEKQLKEYELQLLDAKHSTDGGQEQENATEMENIVHDLEEKLSRAENRAENAEGKCKLLSETNTEIIEELGQLKGVSQKADLLERQLREAETRLQHAVATSEASQEKQNMLYCTIRDMENVIVDLKSKAIKAESRADSTEDKCIILSESNAELNEEIVFLRSRLECLEASLNQAEEKKMVTAKDIGSRTKMITDLVMQLATERERLHKQISSLTQANKALATKIHQTRKESPVVVGLRNHDTGSKLDKMQRNEFAGETEVASTYPMPDSESSRRIDAGVLSRKHVFMAILTILISAAVYFCQPQNIST